MNPLQNIIAVVFDYDKTLSPRHMQEDTVLKRLGVAPAEFWRRSDELVAARHYDNELAWMQLLLELPGADRLSNDELRRLGRELTFYAGLPEAFAELRALAAAPPYAGCGLQIEFYIVTSGLKALVEGSALAPEVRAIFGCEYDERDGRLWRPKRTVSHTAKTQMLFRINKNLLAMNEDVNVHMPDDQRRIPFRNMIYVGDGPTDVPCFRVVMNYGGKTIAVYNPEDRKARDICYDLQIRAGRVHMIAPADYRAGSHLRMILERMIQDMADAVAQRRKP